MQCLPTTQECVNPQGSGFFGRSTLRFKNTRHSFSCPNGRLLPNCPNANPSATRNFHGHHNTSRIQRHAATRQATQRLLRQFLGLAELTPHLARSVPGNTVLTVNEKQNSLDMSQKRATATHKQTNNQPTNQPSKQASKQTSKQTSKCAATSPSW